MSDLAAEIARKYLPEGSECLALGLDIATALAAAERERDEALEKAEDVCFELIMSKEANRVKLKRILALEGGLRRYGEHDEDCMGEPNPPDGEDYPGCPCTCGLDTLLSSPAAPRHQQGD